MNGLVKSIEVKEFSTADGKKKFSKVLFTVDVFIESNGVRTGEVRTRKGSSSVEYFKEYLKHCGVKVKDLLGKEVGVVLTKRAWTTNDGETRVTEEIKYMNILDENGEAIIKYSETSANDLSSLDY